MGLKRGGIEEREHVRFISTSQYDETQTAKAYVLVAVYELLVHTWGEYVIDPEMTCYRKHDIFSFWPHILLSWVISIKWQF